MLGKFSTIISSNIFQTLSFSLLLLGPHNSNVGAFSVVPEVSEIVFNSFSFFFFVLLLTDISTVLSSSSLIHSSASVILLWIPSSVFFISVIVVFISVCLFFSSFRSLLNISYIFSIRASILFPRFWIIFTIITLNSFSGRLPILHLFCLADFNLAPSSVTYFFCCLILFFSLFFNEWDCVPVLMVVWPEASNPGVCRLLGRAGSWC